MVGSRVVPAAYFKNITMNRQDLYRKTVDILYQAYFKNTLQHENCAACAVGNIIAANSGKNYKMAITNLYWEGGDYLWNRLFNTTFGIQNVNTMWLFHPETMAQINSTGYPWQELAKIEYAFETADKGQSAEDYMFNGLVAVLKVLQELHEVEDDAVEITRFAEHRNTRATCSIK